MATTEARKPRHMSIDEFTKEGAPSLQGLVSDDLLSRFNGGSFMQCHTAIFRETGIWIDELVPVFQRLDAALAVKELPRGVN
jgi:hypothetical protein